jgi:hypothetical protein
MATVGVALRVFCVEHGSASNIPLTHLECHYLHRLLWIKEALVHTPTVLPTVLAKTVHAMFYGHVIILGTANTLPVSRSTLFFLEVCVRFRRTQTTNRQEYRVTVQHLCRPRAFVTWRA